MQRIFQFVIFVVGLVGVSVVCADSLPALTITDKAGSTSYSVSLQIVAIMTALTLLPALILTMTSFTRIIIVLAILRQALGMPQTPSNQILIGIAIFLTIFIMGPVLSNINDDALQPYMNGKMDLPVALSRAETHIKNFMVAQTRENDLALFVDLATGDNNKPVIEQAQDTPFMALVPAFITSELKTAFQIGFLLFVPFLVIDLVVASVLMAMGMMMLSPLIISLPFKIMLFVLVDGWTLVVGTIARSFGA